MTESDQLKLMRSIAGPPATILMLLIINGGSLLNTDICYYTNYTGKTVAAALRALNGLGLVQNNGRAYGWSLRSGQLPLPLTSLITATQDGIFPPSTQPGQIEDGNIPPSTKSYPQIIESYPQPTLIEDGNIPPSPGQTGYLYAEDGKFPPSPPSSSSSSKKEEKKKEEKKAADRKIYDLIRAAGISPRSPKGREIIAAGLQPEYVAAHVTAWQAEGKPVGWLITRLLAGDPPPRPRSKTKCPLCGGDHQRDDCRLRDVIRY